VTRHRILGNGEKRWQIDKKPLLAAMAGVNKGVFFQKRRVFVENISIKQSMKVEITLQRKYNVIF
jgi:hypothetical protein